MAYSETELAETTADSTINQLFAPFAEKLSDTSIQVTIFTIGMENKNNVTSFKITYQRMTDKKVAIGSAQNKTSLTNVVDITGLTSNSLYKITTQAISATGEGNKRVVYYKLSTATPVTAKASEKKQIGEKITAKSYLSLTGGETSDNKYTLAYKDFTTIQQGIPGTTYTTVSYGGRNVRNYGSALYYSFGTSIILPPLIKYKPQGAGLGFFLNQASDSGYFVSIETSGTAAAQSTSPVKIFKLVGKQMIKLEDSQRGNKATLDQLFAGKIYNLDVKVKVKDKTVTITAYLNGFKVEATDTTSSTTKNEIIYPTGRVGLVAISGTTMFDYVYADTINADKYDASYELLNFYAGQFSNYFLNTSYGDMLYNSTNDEGIIEKKASFDEFGTVVREIARKKVTFASAPSVPIRWTTGANNLAQILAQTYDNFKSEVFVLNNSSVTIPLSDRGVNQLSIFGNTIGFSGEIEYSTTPASEYAATEPVIFESVWLQNIKDVESLASWIQGKIVNKSKVVTLRVFGNPLVSVGDIITVDYPYQGFTSSQKIIVIKVSQRFKGGIETEIVGRTL